MHKIGLDPLYHRLRHTMKHVRGKLERDKHVIEAVVRTFGPISQAGIHELTHIRPSAISHLARELLNEGRLLEAGRASTPKQAGRKQVLLRLNDEFRFVAGVELDEDNVTTGILDLQPKVRHRATEPANLGGGVEGLVRQLIACTRRALKHAGLRQSALLGIGIADPGLVDSRRGVTVMSSTIKFWNNVPLGDIFQKEFGVPAFVETKTRAKTVAERILGAGEMHEQMIYVDYGAGIGAGVVLDGKLLYGQDCAAGEFGHTHMMEDGPACNCGSFGCLEAVAGARAVETRVRRAVAEGGFTRALELAGGDSQAITAWMVLEAARAGDKICSNITTQMGSYLGLGLANLVNLFNPSVVVLDRRLGQGGEGLLDHIVRVVTRQALVYPSQHASFRYGQLGADAGVLGMALIVLERHYEIPLLKPPRFMVESVGLARGGPPGPNAPAQSVASEKVEAHVGGQRKKTVPA